MAEIKKLAIVIPVYNQWSYTKRALADLSSLSSNHQIIIVDNGSSDATKQLQSSVKIEVVRHLSNLGFAAGVNSGYKRAVELGYENIMFLNNDIRVDSGAGQWTEPLIEQAQLGYIVGPTVGCLDDQFNFICEASKLPTRGYGYLSGWNITASTKTWQKLVLEGNAGPFNQQRFFSYFEDTDLSFRAKELGIELKIVGVPVRHIGRVTGKAIGLGPMYLESKKTFLEIWGKK